MKVHNSVGNNYIIEGKRIVNFHIPGILLICNNWYQFYSVVDTEPNIAAK